MTASLAMCSGSFVALLLLPCSSVISSLRRGAVRICLGFYSTGITTATAIKFPTGLARQPTSCGKRAQQWHSTPCTGGVSKQQKQWLTKIPKNTLKQLNNALTIRSSSKLMAPSPFVSTSKNASLGLESSKGGVEVVRGRIRAKLQ